MIDSGARVADALVVGADAVSSNGDFELARATEELEKSLIVRATSVHTESGNHATMLAPWSVFALEHPELKETKDALSFEDAIGIVREAVRGEPCVLVPKG